MSYWMKQSKINKSEKKGDESNEKETHDSGESKKEIPNVNYNKNRIEKGERVDVCIIGAGITGLTVRILFIKKKF